MFEEIIEAWKKHVSADIPHQQGYVYLRDLHESVEVWHPLKRFADAEVDWWIYQEQIKRRDTPRFDLAIPDLLRLLHHIDDYYKHQARFDSEDEQALVDCAVKTHLNYLCRPRTALKWFVFRGEPTKSLHEVLIRISAFSEYSYILDGFKSWADSNITVHPSERLLSVVEFEKIIASIDSNYILELTPAQFAELLQPLFTFFQIIPQQDSSMALPAEALIVFLDDKEIAPIAAKIEELYEKEGLLHITEDYFLKIVTDFVSELDQDSLSAEQDEANDNESWDSIPSSAENIYDLPQEQAADAEADYANEENVIEHLATETTEFPADISTDIDTEPVDYVDVSQGNSQGAYITAEPVSDLVDALVDSYLSPKNKEEEESAFIAYFTDNNIGPALIAEFNTRFSDESLESNINQPEIIIPDHSAIPVIIHEPEEDHEQQDDDILLDDIQELLELNPEMPDLDPGTKENKKSQEYKRSFLSTIPTERREFFIQRLFSGNRETFTELCSSIDLTEDAGQAGIAYSSVLVDKGLQQFEGSAADIEFRTLLRKFFL
jgi:hypothetical protein